MHGPAVLKYLTYGSVAETCADDRAARLIMWPAFGVMRVLPRTSGTARSGAHCRPGRGATTPFTQGASCAPEPLRWGFVRHEAPWETFQNTVDSRCVAVPW
jgi:hypothetical protein